MIAVRQFYLTTERPPKQIPIELYNTYMQNELYPLRLLFFSSPNVLCHFKNRCSGAWTVVILVDLRTSTGCMSGSKYYD